MRTLQKTFLKFKNLHPVILTVCFFIIFCLVHIFLKKYIYPPTKNQISYTDNNYNVLGLNIPSNLSFCDEKIPSNNFEIKKNLEEEFFSNAYWKANSAVLFSKAQKWFPYIEPILKREGVPDDFKYVAIIESHLSNVTSPAGAAGFWQLVPGSAQNYGLEVNEYVDERLHIEKSTTAACKHIKEAYAIFNNWTLSAAAYNLGIGGIQNALKKQNASNYYELLLNDETGSFIYRILAYKTLFANPAHFGIKKKKWNYLPLIAYKNYKVDSSITNLNALAKHIGCNKATLKFFNPWLLQETLPNPDKKVYIFRVPKNIKQDYSSYIVDLTGKEADLTTSEELTPQKTETTPKDTLTQNKKTIIHVVEEKETLKGIAKFYEVTVKQLKKWNNIKKKQGIVAGQTLNIFYNKPATSQSISPSPHK